ncbi:MAG: hypothetical protein KC776_36930 [Myxococcales bacterium]|nr:hypothetical protein [Myxococcales bacterium]MCB9579653.1 hypothetical protein [Polyangiaceae bacterium]
MRATLLLSVLVLAVVGCGSESDETPSSGGAAGSSSGGSSSGGAAGSATGGSGGAATGGSAGSSSGGAAGSSTGGAAGSGGSAGEIILKVDFEPAPTGPYTKSAMDLEWTGLKWAQGLTEGRVDIVEGAEAHSGKSLRILYPKGGVGPGEGGAQWLVNLPKSFDELYVSYWVKFGTGFDFVKGGKIPGLGGGANNTGGSKPDGTDGWSGRMMWRTGGDAVQYLYHPDQPTIYGEDLGYDIGGQRSFVPGEWVQVEHHFVMNTPGQHDGIVEAWWNGQKAMERTDIRYRDVDTFAIDVFYFSTFFGGSGADWAATKDEYTYFDDFVISTGPITH